MEIIVHNASAALSQGLQLIHKYGEERPSRNGPVLAMDEPVTITYEKPDQRVIFYPERDANPFFHLYECLWMMAGKRDVKSVAAFVPSMRNYSDDGKVFNAAYGYRWRKHFGIDQLWGTINRLRQEGAKHDRRTFMTMYSPKHDTLPTLDVPCNVGIAWRCRSDGTLDMTVFNRSNDLVLGACGANVVHMSFLHELVARASGHPLGKYHQVTNDLHMYTEHEKSVACAPLAGNWNGYRDPYVFGDVKPFPIIDPDLTFEQWMDDLSIFLQYGNVVALRDRFFRRVCAPVMLAHHWFKTNTGESKYEGALEILEQCLASDWKMACQEWVERRYIKWKETTQ